MAGTTSWLPPRDSGGTSGSPAAAASSASLLGEPFFFKTHYPHNRGAGGILQRLGAPAGFGGVGAVRRSQRHRQRGADEDASAATGAPIGSAEDPAIGCLFVRDVRFFPAGGTAEPPPRFAANIAQGKSYDLADQSVAPYFQMLLELLLGAVVELDFRQPSHRPGPVFGDPRLAPHRLGQRSFQAVVPDAYHRRCAISGTHIPLVLRRHTSGLSRPEASTAPTTGCCSDRTSTPLFDRGYLALDPAYRLVVSRRLCQGFQHGDQFYA